MPMVATDSSVATHSCSFEYLSPGGASIMFSQIYRDADPARMPNAADTNQSLRFIKRGTNPNVKISPACRCSALMVFNLSMVSHDGFRRNHRELLFPTRRCSESTANVLFDIYAQQVTR